VPDAVLHSPITTRTDFEGHDDLRTLMRAVFSTLDDIRYYADVGDATQRALFTAVASVASTSKRRRSCASGMTRSSARSRSGFVRCPA
jgi:hypothetical protein